MLPAFTGARAQSYMRRLGSDRCAGAIGDADDARADLQQGRVHIHKVFAVGRGLEASGNGMVCASPSKNRLGVVCGPASRRPLLRRAGHERPKIPQQSLRARGVDRIRKK